MEIKPLEILSICLTVGSLIAAIYKYSDEPKRFPEQILLKTDTLTAYNLKIYAQPGDSDFAQKAEIRVYMQKNFRELPLRHLQDYNELSFANVKDSLLVLGVKTIKSSPKIDTFNVILPDSFPKKITLELMHKFEQIRQGKDLKIYN